jgi:alkanesulfonate monooxygenase SsuD/methylene tetrahydromethanopterin reductase-like flavin-dependent oxidoreductase (luciferase family)
MRYGIVLPISDARRSARLAAAAEAAGWDGIFTWDAVAIDGMDTGDPWVALAAMAMLTERVTLGAMVFAPSRRRPWLFAQSAISVDRLSGGRLVLPAGIGTLDDRGLGGVGEPVAALTRAELLDETLAITAGLAGGEPFGFAGTHYRFASLTLRPAAIQQPRIPVWTVGAWPHERTLNRAIRWDGMVVQAPEGQKSSDPTLIAQVAAWVREHREASGASTAARPFDIVVDGITPADDPAAAAAATQAAADAGATWWIEADWSADAAAALETRIAAGPPRAR